MSDIDQTFVPPPEAPVFEPSEEDFRDPLAYIAKIRPIAEKTGICKIRPPPDWQPPFAVDVENFRFTPRIQRLNELEAKTRIKLNFLDSIAKFWELQGCRLKIPNVCGKCLDLYNLSKIVQDEGGFELACRERRWSRVANRLHYPPGKGVGSQLLKHYERILWPFDVFHSGVPFDEPVQLLPEGDAKDKDYVPHGIPSRQAIKPTCTTGYSRRVKRQAPEEPLTVDISNNPELKKLQLFGPGPKFAGLGLVAQPGEKKDGSDGAWAKLERQGSASDPDYKEPKSSAKKGTKSSPRKAAQLAQEYMQGSSMQMRARTGALASSVIEMYMCHTCGRGDAEDCLLLCDGCDDSFHTFCLIPPLPEVPKGDWRCPTCVAKGLSKKQDPFGFEQAHREYSLQAFGEKADQFKKDFFSMPVHMVPPETIEREFWRLVQSVDDDVLVEYGADIHTLIQGSGFPTKKSKTVAPEDQEYVTSPWNLNNLPVQHESVLCHINADISGMKVPWNYVGMCFSAFCWHNEDHWSYSINYLHWGEPKTWYGVPGSAAEEFEAAMKEQAPELFEAQPDLLHQLVTIMSPTLLMNHGVPIVRTNQCAGEFVVTFPRAYHAGFNQGYNFAEAVNFCPADWLPMGRLCIDHYRSLQRICVFSHEELMCKMAADPDSLDLSMAAAVYKEMLYMVDEEKRYRKALLDRGTQEAEREAFELLPDDERQCEACKTTCFLSAITCACTPSKVVCIQHAGQLCECPGSKQCLRYRYTLDELPAMLQSLKVRAESFDNWANKVKNALEASQDSKLDMCQLKEMIEEADEKHFPDNDLLQQLVNAVAEAEKCASVAIQLVNKKHRTRSKSTDAKFVTKLNYAELTDFMQQVKSLPCEIREADLVQKLVDEVEQYRSDAQDALSDTVPDSDKLRRLLELGTALDIELPEIAKLKQELHQARWLDDVRATLALPTSVTLETLRKLIDSGVSLAPHTAIEKAMAELQELLTVSERWEEKAKICLAAKPRHAMATVEAIISEARNIPAHLPNTLGLKEALRKAKEWSKQIEEIQSGEHFPYLDVLECMVVRGRTVPVRLEPLAQVESQVAAARAWRERAGRTYLKKNTSYALLEVLSPRADVGQYLSGKARRKKQKDLERLKEQEKEYATDVDVGQGSTGTRDPATFVATYKSAEVEEMDAILTLRDKNRRKQQMEEDGIEQGKYCVCRKPVSGFMLQCELCKDWFHTTCVPLPKASKTKFASGAGGGTVSTTSGVQNIKDVKFMCPICQRSRRPRLETILSLLVSLQKLPVRLPEGEALQRLTERAMNWQDRAKQALATDEIAEALTRLSAVTQKGKDHPTKPSKSERSLSSDFKKASKKHALEPVAPAPAAIAAEPSNRVHQDSILHGMPPVPTHSEEMKEEVEEQIEVDMGVSMAMDTSSADGVPTEIPMAVSSGMDTGFASEHAYSAASKPASQPSKKHPRKTPHVPRPMMDPTSPPVLPSLPPPRPSSSSSSSHSHSGGATLELSSFSRAQLEQLMVEGDLLEVTLDETQHLWRILQACQPLNQERFLEHVLDQMPPESLEKLKVRSEIKEKKKMKMKRKREDIDILSADQIKMEKKKKKKEKKEKEAAAVSAAMTGAMTGGPPTTPQKKVVEKVKREGKENKEKQKKKMKKKKEKVLGQGQGQGQGGLAIKKEDVKDETIVNVDGDDDDDDEVCSAKKCLRPLGDDINWVQCDSCEKWYHLLCIGMKQQPDEDEEFVCRICTKKRAIKAGQKSKSSTPGSSTSTTPVSTPIKQESSSLAAQVAAQHLATKGFSMSQSVAKSGKSSGRSSPSTVSSGRSSPATVSSKGTVLGTTGRKSPLPLTSGRRSPTTLPFGRKSPLTLVTGKSFGSPSSPTGASGKKSPLSHLSKTAVSTLPSRALPAETSAVTSTETVVQSSQSVQKDVESMVPKVSEELRVDRAETISEDPDVSQIQPVKLAVGTPKESTVESQAQSTSNKEQEESTKTVMEDISESLVPSKLSSQNSPTTEKLLASPIVPSQSETPTSSMDVDSVETEEVSTLSEKSSEDVQTSQPLQDMDTSQKEKPSKEVLETAPKSMDSTDCAPDVDSVDSKAEDGKVSQEEVAMETEATATVTAQTTPQPEPESEEKMELQPAMEPSSIPAPQSTTPSVNESVPSLPTESVTSAAVIPESTQPSEDVASDVPEIVSEVSSQEPSSPLALEKQTDSDIPESRPQSTEASSMEPAPAIPQPELQEFPKVSEVPAVVQEEDSSSQSDAVEPMEVNESSKAEDVEDKSLSEDQSTSDSTT